jgi:hypothetical protein
MLPLPGWSALSQRAEPIASSAGAKYTERADDLGPPPEDLADSTLPPSEFAEGPDPTSEFAVATLVAASARNAVSAAPAREQLPSVEALVERIPQPVRDALEELFRARFTSVRRLPPPTEPAPVVP